jgi:hypothetical protein
MELYKYLEPVWAERMVRDGSVRVGTLHDFRRIEGLDSERGDLHEGVRISLTDGSPGIVDGKDLPWFLRESFRIPPNVKFQFEKGAVLKVHQNSPDVYVYCTCSKYDEALMELFGGACVKISDSTQFFRAITRALDRCNPDGILHISGFALGRASTLTASKPGPTSLSTIPYFGSLSRTPTNRKFVGCG